MRRAQHFIDLKVSAEAPIALGGGGLRFSLQAHRPDRLVGSHRLFDTLYSSVPYALVEATSPA